jgi:hypothetical protein
MDKKEVRVSGWTAPDLNRTIGVVGNVNTNQLYQSAIKAWGFSPCSPDQYFFSGPKKYWTKKVPFIK